jgi:cell wall assembly regulator SMI1
MQSDWTRITTWIEHNAPDLLEHLEPAADRSELAETETRLSMRLPTLLRTFYTLQNGTTAFAIFPAIEPHQPAFGALPLDEIEFIEPDEDSDESEADFAADPGVRPEFWNPHWIPFAANDAGDYLMLDFAPARDGRPGQVLEWRHDTNERRVTAVSLEALLKQVADGLEAGKYAYDEELGVVRGAEG